MIASYQSTRCLKCGGPRVRYATNRVRTGHGRGSQWQYCCPVCSKRLRRGRYRAQHPRPALARSARQQWAHNLVARATDYYVRKILSQRTGMGAAVWPAALVELKRATVLARRALLAA